MSSDIKEIKQYKSQEYERVALLPITEVLPHILNNINNTKKAKVLFQGYLVNVTSTRLKTFALTGIDCHCCGIQSAYFAIERSKGTSGGYHLNLWAKDKDGNEILMTHDHITARSMGGLDDNTNTETLCGPCNWSKGTLEHAFSKNPNENILKEIQNFKLNNVYRK